MSPISRSVAASIETALKAGPDDIAPKAGPDDNMLPGLQLTDASRPEEHDEANVISASSDEGDDRTALESHSDGSAIESEASGGGASWQTAHLRLMSQMEDLSSLFKSRNRPEQ